MKRAPFVLLPAVLKSYGITSERLGEIIGRNSDTAQRRLKNPENFTLKELAALNKAGIPADDIRECIKFN